MQPEMMMKLTERLKRQNKADLWQVAKPLPVCKLPRCQNPIHSALRLQKCS